jgi:small subunit ribosomal protein S6e
MIRGVYMKLVISDPKTGKTHQADVEKGKEGEVVGKKIGESFDAGVFGAAGYTFEITGGSDTSGFPMRKDISGARKLKALVAEGPGFRPTLHGERRKKMLRGDTVAADTAQVNVKVVQAGPTALEQLFPKKEAEQKK